MAIQFARSERISRGKGGSAVRSAAYAMREKLYDERLGVTYKFKDDGTLRHAQILLVDGVNPKFLDAGTLFNAIESAEKRKDAQVGRVVVIALDHDISDAERVEMAHGFARQLFVDKGFPVLVCIHSPHEGGNHHAHLIGGVRQLGPDGFAAHKLRDTPFAWAFGRPIILEAESVGELWKNFQNSWFVANGKSITVDPVAPVPQEHIGPQRFRSPNDHRVDANEQVRDLNAKIARDPDAVAEHLGQRAFDGRALSRFLTKHVRDPDERTKVHAEVQDKLLRLKRDALEKASWVDKVQSGLRPLSVEDMARQLSPSYAALVKKAAELREEANRTEWVKNRQAGDKEAGEHRVEERWFEMGIARRALHLIGTWRDAEVLRDTELDRWSNLWKRGSYSTDRWSIRQAAIIGKLNVVERRAAAALEEIRPEAQRELERRQRIANNARAALENLERSDRLALRARQTM